MGGRRGGQAAGEGTLKLADKARRAESLREDSCPELSLLHEGRKPMFIQRHEFPLSSGPMFSIRLPAKLAKQGAVVRLLWDPHPAGIPSTMSPAAIQEYVLPARADG